MLDSRDSVSRLAIIEQSWRRTESAGLAPTIDLNEIAIEDYDATSRFIAVSAGVLERMADQLAGTGFNVTLADDQALIVDIRAGSSRLRGQMESIGAALGRPFRESTSGTNAISTAYETRRSIAVRGEEHYVDSFKAYSCFGLPIKDPMTRRLAGILNITCQRGDETQLLRPYMVEAVEQIEQRLLAAASTTERQLLSGFHEWNARSAGTAVVAFGAGLLLANDLAQKTLSQDDYVTLQALGAERIDGELRRLPVSLRDGQKVVAEWQHPASTDIVVFRLRRGEADDRKSAHSSWAAEPALDIGRLVAISGEAGSGKSTVLRGLLGDSRHRRLLHSELANFDWQTGLTKVADGGGPLVVEDVDRADSATIARFAGDARRHGVDVFVTTGPTSEQSAALAAALSAFDLVECAPLRSRRAEFAALARSILEQIAPGGHAKIQPQALAQLLSYPWPGNFVELASVLRRALDAANGGAIREGDLPDRYRHAFGRPLTLLEQAERDAIELALARSQGGKRGAAIALGISRSTLYKRIAELDIRVF
jgi:transcriptional regulator of acetoin/glycerol metabolism